MNAFNMFLSHLGIGPMSSMKKASFEVALKGKKQIAEGTYEFIFEKPKGFSFKAGQHARMTLLNSSETDEKGNSRFLTLANTPQDKDLIVAMRLTDSAFKRVLNTMQIGKKVLIQILLGVPHGAFALHEDVSIPAVFLAGGIGIVPAYSMIKDATERKLSQKLVLFYSNRRPEDAPYLEDLKLFEKQNPNFKLIATMTQARRSKKSWQGETGFINQSMLKKYIDDLNAPIYYIAGLTDMLNAMKKLLKDLKVPEANIRAEDFSVSKMTSMNEGVNNFKKYFLPIVIGLTVLLILIVHAGVGVSVVNYGSMFSLTNPLTYLILGLSVIVIILKVKYVLHLKYKKR
jgi:ferredoxin-NADP reductase